MYYYCLPFSLGTCQNNKFLSKSRNSISIYVRCSNRLNLDLEWQHPASQKRCNLFHLSQITIRGKSATTSTDAMKERKRERERERSSQAKNEPRLTSTDAYKTKINFAFSYLCCSSARQCDQMIELKGSTSVSKSYPTSSSISFDIK